MISKKWSIKNGLYFGKYFKSYQEKHEIIIKSEVSCDGPVTEYSYATLDRTLMYLSLGPQGIV